MSGQWGKVRLGKILLRCVGLSRVRVSRVGPAPSLQSAPSRNPSWALPLTSRKSPAALEGDWWEGFAVLGGVVLCFSGLERWSRFPKFDGHKVHHTPHFKQDSAQSLPNFSCVKMTNLRGSEEGERTEPARKTAIIEMVVGAAGAGGACMRAVMGAQHMKLILKGWT